MLDALGSGGMGRVFRAFDRFDERLVALKVPRGSPRDAGADGYRRAWTTEFARWCRLDHPNVVRALDLATAVEGPVERGTPLLVLERFEGVPAHHALRAGPNDADALRAFARSTLAALGHVHDAGLVHRDLKPGNVLVGERRPSAVKLTDFGLATPVGAADRPGRIRGSLPYVAPEAIRGDPVDGRADLYGLGILLFFLTTGALPCRSADPGAVIRRHLRADGADPSRAISGFPPSWCEFVRTLTRREPRDRPASAAAALDLLGVERPTEVWHGPERAGPPARARVVSSGHDVALAEDGPGGADAVARIRGVARALGARTHRVAPAFAGAGSGVGGWVLELLSEHERGARDAIREYRLEFPFEFLGEIALWDRASARTGGPGRDRLPSLARRVVRLVLDRAARRPRVVLVDPAAREDPLAAAVLDELTAALNRRAASAERVVLVIPAPAESSGRGEAVRRRGPLRSRPGGPTDAGDERASRTGRPAAVRVRAVPDARIRYAEGS